MPKLLSWREGRIGAHRVLVARAQARAAYCVATTALVASLIVTAGPALAQNARSVAPSPTIVTTRTVVVTNDSGPGSLRQAILDAAAGETINFAPTVTGVIVLTTTELLINKNLSIAGPGADVLAVSGNSTHRVFNISSGSVTISDLTVRDGRSLNGPGGGISSSGPLVLINVNLIDNAAGAIGGGLGGGLYATGAVAITGGVFQNNQAATYGGGASVNSLVLSGTQFISNTAPYGGGLRVQGSVTVTGALFEGNLALISDGGALWNGTGSATVAQSVIMSNTAKHGGGGIHNSGTLNLVASTLADNKADSGAAIENSGSVLTLTNSTLSSNHAISGTKGSAGAIHQVVGTAPTLTTWIVNSTIVSNTDQNHTVASVWLEGGTIKMENTILADGDAFDVTQSPGTTFTSLGHNLSDGTLPNALASDRLNKNPLLGPLADNGGPTLTHLPVPGSPAIAAGDNHACPPVDQRGVPRPQAIVCDIGSVEVPLSLPYSTFVPIVSQ